MWLNLYSLQVNSPASQSGAAEKRGKNKKVNFNFLMAPSEGSEIEPTKDAALINVKGKIGLLQQPNWPL